MTDTTYALELTARSVVGKQVKQVRDAGMVPAVIHDHGKESVTVQGPYLAMSRLYAHAGKHHPVQLTAGGKHYTALIKSATFEPKKNQLTHVVFNAVDRNQNVEAEVPIHPRYAEGEESTPAERASLIVLHQLDAVEIRALPSALPDVIYYDAEKLVADGDQVTVADLELPKGVELNDKDGSYLNHPVAMVTTPAAMEAKNASLGGESETTVKESAAEAPAEANGKTETA